MLQVLATILIGFGITSNFFHPAAQGPNALPMLTCFIVVPTLAAFLIMASPEKWAKWISLFMASMELGIGFKVFFIFQTALGGFQLVEEVPWLKNFGINYILGVDGMSALMVLLV